MKKLIIVTAVIALLAVFVFGCQAPARGPTEPIEPSVSSPLIETDEDSVSVSNDEIIIDVNYPQIRHVSLTLDATAIESLERVEIGLWMPNGRGPYLSIMETDGLYIGEFDSDNFHIRIYDYGGRPLNVSYYVTSIFGR